MSTAFPEPLLELLADVFLSDARHDEAPDAAIRALEAGLDSPTLRIIAGLSERTNPFELESLARTVLDELHLSMPERSALVRALARPHARRFLAEATSPGDFARQLSDLSLLDDVDGHHPWCQLHDDWCLASEGLSGVEADVCAALRTEAESLLGSG